MIRFIKLALLLSLVTFSTGCAAILSGKSQTVAVDTNPSGARCELTRQNRVIGTIERTPGAVMLEKTKDDIDVVCHLAGYSDSKAFANSGVDGAVYGNILLGGVIGWGIDSAMGADNKYPETIMVSMVPLRASNSSNARARTVSYSPESSRSVGNSDLKRKLEMLKSLHESGTLTDEEYFEKKSNLLSNL